MLFSRYNSIVLIEERSIPIQLDSSMELELETSPSETLSTGLPLAGGGGASRSAERYEHMDWGGSSPRRQGGLENKRRLKKWAINYRHKYHYYPMVLNGLGLSPILDSLNCSSSTSSRAGACFLQQQRRAMIVNGPDNFDPLI